MPKSPTEKCGRGCRSRRMVGYTELGYETLSWEKPLLGGGEVRGEWRDCKSPTALSKVCVYVGLLRRLCKSPTEDRGRVRVVRCFVTVVWLLVRSDVSLVQSCVSEDFRRQTLRDAVGHVAAPKLCVGGHPPTFSVRTLCRALRSKLCVGGLPPTGRAMVRS